MSDNMQRQVGRRIASWHRWLTGRSATEEDDASKQKKFIGNIGALSDLRRCADARETMLTLGFGRLVAFVYPDAVVAGASSLHPDDISALARTALIMSRVDRCRSHAPDFGRIPRLMSAQVKNRGMPCVSFIRAAGLFSAPDAEEACRYLIGLLPLLSEGKPELDPGHIYQAMRWWDDTRRGWAMDYHTFSAAGPETAADPEAAAE